MKSSIFIGLFSSLFCGYHVGESKAHGGFFADPKEEESRGPNEENPIRIVGRVSTSSSCDEQGIHCRQKREVQRMHIETPKAIFQHQNDVDQNGDHVIKPLVFQLSPANFPLIGPNYKLVIHDGDDDTQVVNNQPLPTCLYNGSLSDNHHVEVAISRCSNDNKLVGTLVDSKLNRNFVIESLSEKHPEYRRLKREADMKATDIEDDDLVLIYETSGGRCGLQKKNRKRLNVPDLSERVKLLEPKEDKSERASEFQRKKRAISKSQMAADKTIEIAVFVDDNLYAKTVSSGAQDPIAAIQSLVFAYLNSVQLLYRSNLLDTKFNIVLVRLEIFKSPEKSMDKRGGNIEGYLESFCRWQASKNPEFWDKLSTNPDHWDHGLLLTGLDLFDNLPKHNSVIGLAWVSGMCHPEYSCTINEGNNFESVYVIAHEMGHNLGMNHDGETDVGNSCDADKYLMSPILGPGKVTWSACSNVEINKFLTNPETRDQAICLTDMPVTVSHYNFLKDGLRPGEQFNAYEQCQQSFGPDFIPHVKENQAPFEDLCRELWCSNSTHALRAHPALEGTDCSAKPYPYGSFCIEGKCVPFYPDDVKPITGNGEDEADTNSIDTKGIVANQPRGASKIDALIDGRPAWYDPIFTEVFIELRMKFEQRFLSPNN